MRYVLVGGFRDGERIELDEQIPTLDLPLLEQFSAINGAGPLLEAGFINPLTERYQVQTWRSAEKVDFVLYAHAGLTSTEVMAKLIRNYRP